MSAATREAQREKRRAKRQRQRGRLEQARRDQYVAEQEAKNQIFAAEHANARATSLQSRVGQLEERLLEEVRANRAHEEAVSQKDRTIADLSVKLETQTKAVEEWRREAIEGRTATKALAELRKEDRDLEKLRRRLREAHEKQAELQTEISRLRALVPPKPRVYVRPVPVAAAE